MRRIADVEKLYNPDIYKKIKKYINSLKFSSVNFNIIKVTSTYSKNKTFQFSIKKINYYTRGDIKSKLKSHKNKPLIGDPILEKNEKNFFGIARKILLTQGLKVNKKNNFKLFKDLNSSRHYFDEEKLSQSWIKTINIDSIDINVMNEACTAPEMRYILKKLGNLKGKTLLDIGCGLGEASVYFASKGAKVTAVDISQSMIETVKKLAKKYNLSITTHQSSIEYLRLSPKNKFDIIYVGNLFHHVNIDKALEQIKLFLKPGGVLACWEPLHYNPVINIYRRLATKVRSKEERPIKLSDINKFRNYFSHIQLKYFWLTTLLIFVVMVFLQKRNPNKERLWKAVVVEEEKWKPIYLPLEKLDNLLLKFFPILNPLCWNIVIIASGKL